MIWNINQGKLTLKPVTEDYPNTKRGILPFLSSVFDPLGVWTPSLLEPKLIIEELWKLKISWDEQIPKELECRWMLWKKRDDKHISCQPTMLVIIFWNFTIF